MNLQTDGRLATIELSEQLDAHGVEQLIVKLGTLRASMQPEVTELPPGATPYPADRSVLQSLDAGAQVAQLRSGGFRFWMRNMGIGWCAYEVPDKTAAVIARYIASRVPEHFGAIDLIGTNVPDAKH